MKATPSLLPWTACACGRSRQRRKPHAPVWVHGASYAAPVAEPDVWLGNYSRHQPKSRCVIFLCSTAQTGLCPATRPTKCSELALFMLPANALNLKEIPAVVQNEFVILDLRSTRVQYFTRVGRTSFRRSSP